CARDRNFWRGYFGWFDVW
nr:immunoglobulin heavy chain junction region [Macaca mulatta]MPN69611.1 immunoglobulin heavy chain junction region [Macaca mulatta]MPN69639.1 immunoglobulin heavy chain junction region [Macaca mulatta]MPN69893.1 immunoglobulin heavy chain junction region [Macaca mulatta]MPN70149.1 immunoglobulin heavy chain junction region [Macaca mulatta]